MPLFFLSECRAPIPSKILVIQAHIQSHKLIVCLYDVCEIAVMASACPARKYAYSLGLCLERSTI